MNIGVFGGTFDPIHNGHLQIAEVARERLNLAVVLFIPAGQPWLKQDRPLSAAEHRMQMVGLALEDKPYFKASATEVERTGPSYTVDTLLDMQSHLDADDSLFFILGWDSLAELPKWHEPSKILEICYLVVAPRPGYRRPNLRALNSSIPSISRRVVFLNGPQIDISASDIRERVAQGLSVRHLVPEAVNQYIRQHGLYMAK